MSATKKFPPNREYSLGSYTPCMENIMNESLMNSKVIVGETDTTQSKDKCKSYCTQNIYNMKQHMFYKT